jgi:16S rRNA (cytidine1402-2'-O)-methyltransferase
MPSNSPTLEAAIVEPGALYVVATPIGNRDDITLRALKVLAAVDLIAAEDTRRTAKLLAMHRIQGRLLSYGEHNEAQRTPLLLERLAAGEALALVTDAGTPGVSDPGYRLVRAAAERGLRVVPLPGPCAPMAALCAAGLPTSSFLFVGFPARRGERRQCQLAELARQPHTLILYESARRLLPLLDDLLAALGDRPAVLARELTKLHEEFIRLPLAALRAELAARPEIRGECTLLVAGGDEGGGAGEGGAAALQAALAEGLAAGDAPLPEVVRRVARRLALPRREVYAAALALQRRERG